MLELSRVITPRVVALVKYDRGTAGVNFTKGAPQRIPRTHRLFMAIRAPVASAHDIGDPGPAETELKKTWVMLDVDSEWTWKVSGLESLTVNYIFSGADWGGDDLLLLRSPLAAVVPDAVADGACSGRVADVV